MKCILVDNQVAAVADSFNYEEGAWHTPASRLGYLTNPDLIVMDCPEGTVEGMSLAAGQFVINTSRSAALVSFIDTDVDAIYAAVQGNRGPEYALAEAEATAFKAGGYVAPAPSSVASWATAKGESAQWAADNILATAAAWRYAMGVIRNQRLAHKELARTSNDLNAVKTSWQAFANGIRSQLGIA